MAKMVHFFGGKADPPGTVSQNCLSQFYPCTFKDGDMTFNCMEQYMMYNKAKLFNDTEMAERIMQSSVPKEIKRYGRQVRGYNDLKWDKYKRDVVYRGNLLKFGQNPELKDYLLSTGDAYLAEASPYDKIWGIGLRASDPRAHDVKQWKGKNLLGYTLMRVRYALRQKS